MAALIIQTAFNKHSEAFEQLFRNFKYLHFGDEEQAQAFDEVYTDILIKQQQNKNQYYDQYPYQNNEQMIYQNKYSGQDEQLNPVEKVRKKQVDALAQFMQGWDYIQIQQNGRKTKNQNQQVGQRRDQLQVENYYQLYNAKNNIKKTKNKDIHHQKQDINQMVKRNQNQIQFTHKQDVVQYERQLQNPQNLSNDRNNKKGTNQFAAYKKQLANLEDEYHDEKVIATEKMVKKRIIIGNTQQSSIKIKSNQIQRKDKAKSTRIYKIDNDSLRKHSLKKQKEAQSQMMANIQFLRNLRGSAQQNSQKKQWKQGRLQNRNLIEELRSSRRKQLQSLGFVGQNNSILSKGDTPIKNMTADIYTLNNSSQLLPELKQSRKKGQIFKPAAFSIYTIQKTNEVFYNNYTK